MTATRSWLWPWRPPAGVRRVTLAAVEFFEPLAAARVWPWVALTISATPILLGYAAGTSLHQLVTGLLLTPLFLACVRHDRFARAVGVVSLTILTHSAVAILLSAHEASTAAILPRSGPYWERTLHWVQTGEDAEYEWRVWLPAHLVLLTSVPVTAYVSLGAVPLAMGLEEVDLMNYYVGRLMAESDSPWLALVCGWHPWSVVRGLAYTVLTYEAASWSLERLTGEVLSTRRRRAWRWGVGIMLAVCDAVVKLTLAPTVREQLFNNLRI